MTFKLIKLDLIAILQTAKSIMLHSYKELDSNLILLSNLTKNISNNSEIGNLVITVVTYQSENYHSTLFTDT